MKHKKIKCNKTSYAFMLVQMLMWLNVVMGVSSGCFCFLSERLKADNEDGGRDIGGLSKRGESMTVI